MNFPSIILGELNETQQQHKERLMQVLKRYLPLRAVEYCSELIMQHKLHLHIEVARQDRLGDYSPHLGKGNRISINHNLNPYEFLITFTHEIAHFIAYKKFGNKHQPHGTEWKQCFKDCLRPFVMQRIFPPDIERPLIKHMQYPRYTHTGDSNLMRALMQYDKEKFILLEQLQEGTLFKIRKNGRQIFRKGKLLKDYFECVEITKNMKYKVSVIAKVFTVELKK